MDQPRALEFFAGIGLARIGLEQAGWDIAWSNDIAKFKRDMYAHHFGDTSHYLLADIATTRGHDIPDADLAWSSSPCTDLSLAGGRAGLDGAHSGAFWHFIRCLDEMGPRRPCTAILENVTGLASSHGGADLRAAITAFNRLGYSVDVLAIDARRFVPQSRPRLFVTATTQPVHGNPDHPLRPEPLARLHDDTSLRMHHTPLPEPPPAMDAGLDGIIEQLGDDDPRWWNDKHITHRFWPNLHPGHRARVDELRRDDTITYRTMYRRTRDGKAVWEVRPDAIAGCLRTSSGGSSRQVVLRLGRGTVSARLLTTSEQARLMGAPGYRVDATRIDDARSLYGFGDGVVAPVVEWLARALTSARQHPSPAR